MRPGIFDELPGLLNRSPPPERPLHTQRAVMAIRRGSDRGDTGVMAWPAGKPLGGHVMTAAIAALRHANLRAEAVQGVGSPLAPYPLALTALTCRNACGRRPAHVPRTRKAVESTRGCTLPRMALPGAVMATRSAVFRIGATLRPVGEGDLSLIH